MKTRGLAGAAMLMTLISSVPMLSASAQQPDFEQVQRELFAAGGTFVNAWADYDNDGDLDQFVGFDGMPNRLYRNTGGRFADVAATAGIADNRATRAAAWGDADADGDPDLLVGFAPTKTDAPNTSLVAFYRNSNGAFSDESRTAGLIVESGAVRQPTWVDYDGDGDLDLFVAFRDKPNAMFRNDNGRFTNVAGAIGLADPRRTVGAVWFDFDGDGYLDLITGNMDGDPNGLFVQHEGRFTDVAVNAGVAWGGRTPHDQSNGTVRPCVADVDNDGRLDLFFANYGKNGLFLNRGDRFEDASHSWRIDIDARYDSCAFADMDNDGDLDLYVNGTVTGGKQYDDYLFRNEGTRFENVTPGTIGSPNSDHGVQWVDFDGDGDMDLSLTGVQKDGMHWLLRNALQVTSATRAIQVRVLDHKGRALLAGSEITIDNRRARLVDAGSGYNSQNDMPVHIVVAKTSSARVAVRVKRGAGSGVAGFDINAMRPSRGGTYELRVPATTLRD